MRTGRSKCCLEWEHPEEGLTRREQNQPCTRRTGSRGTERAGDSGLNCTLMCSQTCSFYKWCFKHFKSKSFKEPAGNQLLSHMVGTFKKLSWRWCSALKVRSPLHPAHRYFLQSKIMFEILEQLCSKNAYFSNSLCSYYKKNLPFQVSILEFFALDLWLETHTKPYIEIHKPEVAGVCIQPKFQIKFASASLCLNDRTTPPGIIWYNLKMGPEHKVNWLMSNAIGIQAFPRQCWALCAWRTM